MHQCHHSPLVPLRTCWLFSTKQLPDQCWFIVQQIMGNTNLTKHIDIFNQNVFENIACKNSIKTTPSTVTWYSVINSIIHQRESGKCCCLLPKYLYLTCTWLKNYLMYLMSSKYSEYLYLYLYLQIWKSTCTWLKYFEKYLTPTLLGRYVEGHLSYWLWHNWFHWYMPELNS